MDFKLSTELKVYRASWYFSDDRVVETDRDNHLSLSSPHTHYSLLSSRWWFFIYNRNGDWALLRPCTLSIEIPVSVFFSERTGHLLHFIWEWVLDSTEIFPYISFGLDPSQMAEKTAASVCSIELFLVSRSGFLPQKTW